MIMFCTLRALLINMRHCHFCLHIDQLAGRQSPLIFAYFQLDNWSRNSGVFILGARCPLYSCQHSRAFYWQLINWPRGYTRNTRESLQLFPHFPGLVSSESVCEQLPHPRWPLSSGCSWPELCFHTQAQRGAEWPWGGGTSDTHPLSRKLLTKHRGRRVVSSRPKFPENWAPEFSTKNI